MKDTTRRIMMERPHMISPRSWDSPAEVTTFTYDEMNRLTGASGGYSASYTYSTNGKLLTKSEQYSYTLSYNDSAHKHAATTTTSGNGGGTFNMTYDADGNMITENSDTFTYNGDNQLIKHVISGGATITYTYDGKGTLVKKSSTDGTSTVYIGGHIREAPGRELHHLLQ